MIACVAGELDRLHQRTDFKADDDLVFAHPLLGTVLDASKLRKRFVDAVARAGLRPIRFPDLRHTFGTQAAVAGVPLRTLQEWMGHRDYKTTLIYADYAPRTYERELMERVRPGAARRLPRRRRRRRDGHYLTRQQPSQAGSG
jgi:integrase